MSEADEVAAKLPLPEGEWNESDLRRYVKSYMPNESEQVIDNVTEALAQRMEKHE